MRYIIVKTARPGARRSHDTAEPLDQQWQRAALAKSGKCGSLHRRAGGSTSPLAAGGQNTSAILPPRSPEGAL